MTGNEQQGYKEHASRLRRLRLPDPPKDAGPEYAAVTAKTTEGRRDDTPESTGTNKAGDWQA